MDGLQRRPRSNPKNDEVIVVGHIRIACVRDGKADWGNSVETAALPPLNPRQRHILIFIHTHIVAHGFPPTVAEIAAGVGLGSTQTVSYHLRRLAEMGYLRLRSDVPRGLQFASLAVISLKPAVEGSP